MATIPEIAVAMERLADSMPPPRGVNPAKAFAGYEAALSSFRADDINEAITRYLSGAFPNISLKFYPRAPELASCVRAVVAERSADLDKVRRQQALKTGQEEVAQAEEFFRNRPPEARLRVAALYDEFRSNLRDSKNAKTAAERERQHAEIRARYGMTEEALAKVPDRPLPKGMAAVAGAKSSDQLSRRENRQGEPDELGALFDANP